MKLSVGGSSDSSHAKLRKSFLLRKNSLDMYLAKLPMVDSIPEYRLADMIEGWLEEWFSQRKSDLLQMIQHHMEEKSIGVNDGIVGDYIASLVAELEALGGKGVSYGTEPPHVIEAKRICLDAGVYLKPDGKCFRKLARILLDILGETHRWELECIAAGEDCFFYPKVLESFLSRLTPADLPPSAPAAVRSITIIELFEQYKACLRSRGITEKSLEEYDVPMRLMTEFLGNVAIHTLTFDDFERIRECFMQLPVRKGKKYQGKSFRGPNHYLNER